MPQPTLLSIYNSLVQSYFDYCSLVWGNSGKTSSNKLQKLQNRGARVMLHRAVTLTLIPCFKNLAGKTYIVNVIVNVQFNSESLFKIFKSLNGLVPEYLKSKLVTRNVSNYALRDSAIKLVVAFPRTNYLKIVLVTAAQPFGTAYTVTLESLVP